VHTKNKSAIVVFLFMAISFAVVMSFDYTDEYVSDRFKKAVEAGQYVRGEGFSLDGFLQYYDWDEVCVVLPGSTRDFRNRLGLAYEHAADEDSVWSLVFIRKDYVVAEIAIDRGFLELPLGLDESCFDRWSAIVSIDDNQNATDVGLRLSFSAI